MVHPLVAVGIDVVVGAEGPLVELHLGALIDDRALVAAERQPVLLVFEEILPRLRPDRFEDEAQMRGDRIVAQNRVSRLDEVECAEHCERAEHREQDEQIR